MGESEKNESNGCGRRAGGEADCGSPSCWLVSFLDCESVRTDGGVIQWPLKFLDTTVGIPNAS